MNAQASLNSFATLAAIDVNKYVEKKGGLSYLSWAWAVDQLMRKDPNANWEFHEPTMFGETMMVSCTVTAFNKPITMHLPVMDHKNQAIKNPDAFQVNKNMMRCLVKAIACHGLGLYIYAGDDLPADAAGEADEILSKLREASMEGTKELRKVFDAMPQSDIKVAVWEKNKGSLWAAAKRVDTAGQA